TSLLFVGEDCCACLLVAHTVGVAVQHEAEAVAAAAFVARLADPFSQILDWEGSESGSDFVWISSAYSFERCRCSWWKRIERIARIIEPQQLGWTLCASLLALLCVRKVDCAR